MMNDRKRPGRVLAVTSGKGGVGKTNISTNLAICLAASRKRVLLLDADLSLGNVDIIMNINSKYNISHMLSGRKTLEEIVQTGPEGVEVVCGVSGLESMANLTELNRHRILKGLSDLAAERDVIIVDTPAGIGKTGIGFCLAADHVLVITTPEATSMTDAYSMIKVLSANSFAGRISLVVNMADSFTEGKRTYQQISTVARRFLNAHVYNGGVLLRDERLRAAVKQRKPVVLAYPRARISGSLAALAATLGHGNWESSGSEGFFKKVVDWFF